MLPRYSDDADILSVPPEIVHSILAFLSPAELLNLGRVSQGLYLSITDDILWKDKFNKHFPHLLSQILEDETWLHAFKRAYQREYKNLPDHIATLFSMVKEENVDGLKNFNLFEDCPEATYIEEALAIQDGTGHKIEYWLRKIANQAMYDGFFNLLKKAYDGARSLQRNKHEKTILYWALTYNQSPAIIRSLLEHGSRLNELYTINHNICDFYPIHRAAALGHLDQLQYIVKLHSVQLEQKDRNGNTPLLWAVMGVENNPVVEFLIKNKANLNAVGANLAQDLKHITPLLYAVIKNKPHYLRMLLDNGADCNVKHGELQDQAIHIAVKAGNIEVIRLLLEYRADLIYETNKTNETPLILALKNGHDEIASLLIDSDPYVPITASKWETKKNINGRLNIQQIDTSSLNIAASNNRETALHIAVKNQKINLVKKLIKAGASLQQASDDRGFKAIHLAAETGNIELVQLICELAGAEILNETTNSQHTILHIAAISNNKELVEYLIHNKVDTNIKANYFDNASTEISAYHLALVHGYSDICEMLELSGTITSGRLHALIQHKKMKIIKHMIDNKNITQEDLKFRDDRGRTVLMLAAQHGEVEMMKHLINSMPHFLQIDAKIEHYLGSRYMDQGKSALCFAIQNEHADCVEVLLKAGADIAINDEFKRSPLIVAVTENNIEAVKLLLKYKADIDYIAIDQRHHNSGKSILDLAIETNNAALIDIIKRHYLSSDLNENVFIDKTSRLNLSSAIDNLNNQIKGDDLLSVKTKDLIRSTSSLIKCLNSDSPEITPDDKMNHIIHYKNKYGSGRKIGSDIAKLALCVGVAAIVAVACSLIIATGLGLFMGLGPLAGTAAMISIFKFAFFDLPHIIAGISLLTGIVFGSALSIKLGVFSSSPRENAVDRLVGRSEKLVSLEKKQLKSKEDKNKIQFNDDDSETIDIPRQSKLSLAL